MRRARGINPNRMFELTGWIDLELISPEGKGDWDDVTGKFIPAPEIDPVIIKANVQPFKASQTFMLPEAERTKEWVNVWSPNEIKKMREGPDGWDADKFVYEDNIYKVMAVRKYKMGVLDHYHAQAAKVSSTARGVNIDG